MCKPLYGICNKTEISHSSLLSEWTPLSSNNDFVPRYKNKIVLKVYRYNIFQVVTFKAGTEQNYEVFYKQRQ